MARAKYALAVAVVALVATALTRRAAAFPTSRLVYARAPGTEECPDQTIVRKAVASRLGYDPFFPSSDKTIIARIRRDADHLAGEVELVDEHGVELGLRKFSAEAGKCADLVRAMALSISIAIDPKSTETYAQGPPDDPGATATPRADERAPPPPKPAVRTPRAAPPSNDAVDTPPRAETQTTTHWSIGASALGSLGLAPKLALGGVGFVSAQRSAWSLALEARALAPVTDERDGVRFRTTSYALGVVPCFHWGPAFGCEVTALGSVSASGAEPGANSGARLLFAFGGRVGAEVPLAPWLGLVADAEMLLVPWPVALAASGHPVWQTERITGKLGLGVAVHFQ